jgi:Straboviridae dCMP hydroxymethylase
MTNEEVLKPIFATLHNKVLNGDFIIDKSGVKCVELIAPRIELDPTQPTLEFPGRKTPIKYCEAESEWYHSMDLSVEKIGQVAEIWKKIASQDGKVNSNYGWCIYSADNGSQYKHSIEELKANKDSRRACHIYNRPSMQVDYNRNGMSDFMCTFATQQFIRNDELIYVVMMRSNDAIFGFFNDFYWHCEVYDEMYHDLLDTYQELEIGKIIWVANSFHVYERHFDMLKEMVSEE